MTLIHLYLQSDYYLFHSPAAFVINTIFFLLILTILLLINVLILRVKANIDSAYQEKKYAQWRVMVMAYLSDSSVIKDIRASIPTKDLDLFSSFIIHFFENLITQCS